MLKNPQNEARVQRGMLFDLMFGGSVLTANPLLYPIRDIQPVNSTSAEYKAEVANVEKALICPATKKLLDTPVLARQCKHITSKSAWKPGKNHCPVEDCQTETKYHHLPTLSVLINHLRALSPAHGDEDNLEDKNVKLNLLESCNRLDKAITRSIIKSLSCPLTEQVFFSPVISIYCGSNKQTCIQIYEEIKIGEIETGVCKCGCNNLLKNLKTQLVPLPILSQLINVLAKHSLKILDAQFFSIGYFLRYLDAWNKDKLIHIMQQFYRNPDLLNKPREYPLVKDSTALIALLSTPKGVDLLENNAYLRKIITAAGLNYRMQETSQLEECSALMLICYQTPELFIKEPRLLAFIEFETFFTKANYYERSACEGLMQTPEGLSILKKDSRLLNAQWGSTSTCKILMTDRYFLKANPDVVLRLSLMNLSSLFMYDSGLELYEEKPELFARMTDAIFNNATVPDADTFTHFPVFGLIVRAEGCEFLIRHPELCARIAPETLLKPFEEMITPSSFLLLTPGGNDLLLRSAVMRSKITLAGLFAHVVDTPGSAPQLCVSVLVNTKPGCDLLNTILADNSGLCIDLFDSLTESMRAQLIIKGVDFKLRVRVQRLHEIYIKNNIITQYTQTVPPLTIGIAKALITSAARDDVASVNFLLSLNYDVNAQAYITQTTALHAAVQGGANNTIKILEAHGARWDIPDIYGKTPREYAEENANAMAPSFMKMCL